MKYFSYGMNTNLGSMAMRCPSARSLGAAVLPHYMFEFKSFATVTPKWATNVMEYCGKSQKNAKRV